MSLIIHQHTPAGKTPTSYWSVNSFIIVVYEKFFFKVQSKISVESLTEKNCSHRQNITKLFTLQ